MANKKPKRITVTKHKIENKSLVKRINNTHINSDYRYKMQSLTRDLHNI